MAADEEGSRNTDTSSQSNTDRSISRLHPASTEDRGHLISRARSFLQLPQVANQDISARRRFLQEKGLDGAEIESLLRDVPPPTPFVPPRTYPQPPPSNLPNLLLGISRVFSWLVGGSALLIFIYYRLLLPRIARSSLARHSLRSHHVTLMRRLTTSLSSFKETQAETWSILPKAELWREPLEYSKCSSIEAITGSFGEKEAPYDTVPPITILRCALTDLERKSDAEQKPTTDELFRYLEEQIPWLTSAEGQKFEQVLWEVLSSCSLFVATPPLSPPPTIQQPQSPRWAYCPPLPPDPSPVIKSLSVLKTSLPKDQGSKPRILQGTLETLTEFTGYISTQVYMPYRPSTGGVGMGGNLGPIEEQLRREIRALKGLVLNRRSFMPPTARTAIAAPTSTP